MHLYNRTWKSPRIYTYVPQAIIFALNQTVLFPWRTRALTMSPSRTTDSFLSRSWNAAPQPIERESLKGKSKTINPTCHPTFPSLRYLHPTFPTVRYLHPTFHTVRYLNPTFPTVRYLHLGLIDFLAAMAITQAGLLTGKDAPTQATLKNCYQHVDHLISD